MKLHTYRVDKPGNRSVVYLSAKTAGAGRLKVSLCRAPNCMFHESASIAARRWVRGEVATLKGRDLECAKYIGMFDTDTGQIELSSHPIILIGQGAYINVVPGMTVQMVEKAMHSWASNGHKLQGWNVPPLFENPEARQRFLDFILPW